MSGRGRPATGVRVEVRIPADVLALVDTMAATQGTTRPVVIRELLRAAVAPIGSNVGTWVALDR